MSHIQLIVGVGGLDFSWAPGEVVDLPEEEAAKWADGERAIRRRDLDDPQRETTDRRPPATPNPGGPARDTTDATPPIERADASTPEHPGDPAEADVGDPDATDPAETGTGDTAGTDNGAPEDTGDGAPGTPEAAPADAAPVAVPPRSGHGSGAHAWRTYAESLGMTVPDGAKRDDIVALLDAAGLPTE